MAYSGPKSMDGVHGADIQPGAGLILHMALIAADTGNDILRVAGEDFFPYSGSQIQERPMEIRSQAPSARKRSMCSGLWKPPTTSIFACTPAAFMALA